MFQVKNSEKTNKRKELVMKRIMALLKKEKFSLTGCPIDKNGKRLKPRGAVGIMYSLVETVKI